MLPAFRMFMYTPNLLKHPSPGGGGGGGASMSASSYLAAARWHLLPSLELEPELATEEMQDDDAWKRGEDEGRASGYGGTERGTGRGRDGRGEAAVPGSLKAVMLISRSAGVSWYQAQAQT